MKKILVALLLLAALSGFAVAQGLEGLSVGGEVWNDPSEEDSYGDNSLGVAPYAEYEKSIDLLDLYLKGEYLINLDDETNQALYLEEDFTFNLGKAGPGDLSVTLNNYNLFGTSIDKEVRGGVYFYPPDDGIYVEDETIKRVRGVFEPSVSYAFEPLTVTVGLPIGYVPTGEQFEDAQYIDLYATIGFEHESGFGIEATGNFNLSHEWAGGEDPEKENFYELDVVLSYKYQELIAGTLEVDFPKDWDGKLFKDYVFIPGVEVYVDKLTFYAAVEIDYYADKEKAGKDNKTQVGFLAGIKYSF
jgi:hypothetical protein